MSVKFIVMTGSLSIMFRNSATTGWIGFAVLCASAIVLANQAFNCSGSLGSQPPSRLVRVIGVDG